MSFGQYLLSAKVKGTSTISSTMNVVSLSNEFISVDSQNALIGGMYIISIWVI